MTPAGALYTVKHIATDNVVSLHGRQLQKGDAVALDGYSIGMDPEYVGDPEEFRPERWLPEAVAARKGTPREVIDHPFLKEPFSQGKLLSQSEGFLYFLPVTNLLLCLLWLLNVFRGQEMPWITCCHQ